MNMAALNTYQQEALRTIGHVTGDHEGLAILGLGIAGEAGEVADYIKKVIGHGHPMDRSKIIRELGDVMWYVAALAHIVGVPLSDVAAINIAKLRERYPDGFSKEASRKRVDQS